MGMTSLLWLALFSSLAFTTCAGLRLELTHVDANRTVEERMRRAMARTHQHRLASMNAVAAPIHWMKTQYIAEYLIGDPPQRAEAIIDTGSNLVWTQCSGCSSSSTGCFTQNLPYYDPSKSSTAQGVACGDAACALGSETQCASDDETCTVDTGYGAGDIAGVLGIETFTFGSEKVTLDFGCITLTELTRGSLDGASGIIGLGRGGLSLVSQLQDTKFSYCLTPYNTANTVDQSVLSVGSSAGLSPGNNAPVTSVPFVTNPNEDPYSTFYYLPLTGIAVGETTLDIPASAFALRQVSSGEWVGTFIDSGSPFTSLVGVAYKALKDELARQPRAAAGGWAGPVRRAGRRRKGGAAAGAALRERRRGLGGAAGELLGARGRRHGVHDGVQIVVRSADNHWQLHAAEHAPALRPRQWRALLPGGGLQLHVIPSDSTPIYLYMCARHTICTSTTTTTTY